MSGSSGRTEKVEGVQWHVALHREYLTQHFAVNLEGLAYRGRWPIARFLWREAEDLKLFQVATGPALSEGIQVHLTRDAWVSPRQRVAVDEWYLLRLPLADLKVRTWQTALAKAKECLEGPSGGRGTATVTTWRSRAREQLNVCPHLNFGLQLHSDGGTSERVVEMRRAMEQLKPIHQFVEESCR